MSLLSIIQSHARLHAISVPSSVIGSTDTNTLQLYEIMIELLGEIVTESKFNVTTQEATHTLIASENQGALATLCPSGYQFAIFETFYDRTGRIVFTTSRGLPGVGLPRTRGKKDKGPSWEGVKDMTSGTINVAIEDDTMPGGPIQRTITYVAPFDRCDREADYALAWAEFKRRGL